MNFSATIITLNEENNIARAIKSLDFVQEIIVIDSFSQDRTAEIAESLGAKVVSEKFLGYGQQKNFAADLCQNDWILNIDADEEVSPELKESILKYFQKEVTPRSLFRLKRRTQFCGKYIYHGGWYPDWVPRLYNRKFSKWTTPPVHENLLPMEGSFEDIKLEGHLNHFSFPTVESQVKTNVKYARLGADALLKKKKRTPSLLEMFFRPLVKFVECYFLKKGIMDGLPGLIIAINAAYSMFMKYTFAGLDHSKDSP